MKAEKLIIYLSIFFILSWISGFFLIIKYVQDHTISSNGGVISKTNNIDKTNKVVNISNIESEITDIVKKSSPGVVSIIISKDLTYYKRDPWGFFNTPAGTVKQEVGGGTGFFVTKDGIIITNKHVVSDPNAQYSVLTSDGKEYDATLLATDPLTDLAIIKIDGAGEDFTTLDFISSEEEVNIGEFGIAIGNSLAEFQNSVSLGVISGKNRSIDAQGEKLTGLLQTDAAINPGNSGGPLVNLNGQVMGINTAIVSNSNSLGFSIPLSKKKVDYILNSIKKYGEIKRPFIGINYAIIYDGIQQGLGIDLDHGAYILDQEGSVVTGSQAQKAGLEKKDIILQADGIDITIANDLNSIIQNKIPGDTLNLLVQKSSGEQKNIQLELGLSE